MSDERLLRAVQLHKEEKLREAEQLYREVLEVEPMHPDAIYLLGTLEYQKGNFPAAEKFLLGARDLRPEHPETHNNLGLVFQELGKLDEAQAAFELALRFVPRYADARLNQATLCRARGQFETAVDHYRLYVKQNRKSAVGYEGLSAALANLGQHSEALAVVDRAIALDPGRPIAHNNRGAILRELGRPAEAVAAYRTALRLDPNLASAHSNLGAALLDLGEVDAAVDQARQAVALRPEDPVAHNNLGSALYHRGEDDQAAAHFRRALQQRPDFAAAHHNLANCLRRGGELEAADRAYRAALICKPGYAQAYANHGHLLEEIDRIDEARECFQRLAVLEPRNVLWRFRAAGLCPTVFADNDQIDAYRRGLVRMLEDSQEAFRRVRFDELLEAGFRPPFNLPFHGRDDRPIKELFASAFAPCFRDRPARFGTGLPRVGFVVTDRHERAFAKSIGGFLAHFDRGRIEPIVVCSRAGAAKLPAMMPPAVCYLELPESPTKAVEAIRGGRFDLLYFWEIGTDPANYFLPFCRLAPLQCTSWGIQVTSGIRAVDVYISSERIEPPDGSDQYTERLVLLQTMLSYQYRLPPPAQLRSRADFGLAADRHVYLCPQHLGKFHPDFDPILASILRRDPQGELVITEGKRYETRRQLQERFRRHMPDVAERIRFVPNQAGDDYSSLLLQADVLLDPLPFGGVNTTYDALSLGKVIVTMPGRFQRGRYTAGCLRTTGVVDSIAATADEYVDRAVQLATDCDFRGDVETRLREASAVLFENRAAARELEDLLVQLVETGRR